MALLFVDGFDHYATAQITRKWTAYSAFTIASGGRNSTNRLYRSGNIATGEYCYRDFPSTYTNGVAGFAFKIGYLGGWMQLCSFSTGGTAQVSVQVDSTGKVAFCRGGNQFGAPSAVIEQTASAVITAGSEYFIEVKFEIHDTTGSYSVKLDGVEILSGTGVDTKVSGDTWNRFYIGYGGQSPYSGNYGIDDLYVCDLSGSTNNDFLGDCRVLTLFPDGAGNSTEFTPSSGSNYACVDEASVDDDTSYVSSNIAADIDLYTFGALSYSPSAIYGVQLSATAKRDSGTRSLKQKSRVGGTTRDAGSSVSLTTSYAVQSTVLETDPDTAAAWTESGINASEFGFEVV